MSKKTFKIVNWHEVKEDSYKLIYEQAITRFEEFASESESITDKSIKILTAVISLSAFYIAYCLGTPIKIPAGIVLSILLVLFIIELKTLYKLTSSKKKVAYRGVDPAIAAQETVFDKENKDYQIQGMYYNLISVIDDNIDFMFKKNQSRAKDYELALILLYSIIILIGVYVGLTYHYRP